MKVIKDSKVSVSDVDGTLITVFAEDWQEGVFELEHEGFKMKVKPNLENIDALKELKTNDHYIIVWSHSGAEWAEKVVKALNLDAYVDVVMNKPSYVLEDEHTVLPCAKTICIEGGKNKWDSNSPMPVCYPY